MALLSVMRDNVPFRPSNACCCVYGLDMAVLRLCLTDSNIRTSLLEVMIRREDAYDEHRWGAARTSQVACATDCDGVLWGAVCVGGVWGGLRNLDLSLVAFVHCRAAHSGCPHRGPSSACSSMSQ